MTKPNDEGYQRNELLEDIGLKLTQYGTNFMNPDDPRAEQWAEERKKYGFDSREIWNMDEIYVEWIYSHFKMYKDIAEVDNHAVDLMYYEEPDEVPRIVSKAEAIDIILDECKKCLTNGDIDQSCPPRGVMYLIADIMPMMWW